MHAYKYNEFVSNRRYFVVCCIVALCTIHNRYTCLYTTKSSVYYRDYNLVYCAFSIEQKNIIINYQYSSSQFSFMRVRIKWYFLLVLYTERLHTNSIPLFTLFMTFYFFFRTFAFNTNARTVNS